MFGGIVRAPGSGRLTYHGKACLVKVETWGMWQEYDPSWCKEAHWIKGQDFLKVSDLGHCVEPIPPRHWPETGGVIRWTIPENWTAAQLEADVKERIAHFYGTAPELVEVIGSEVSQVSSAAPQRR